MSVNPIVTVAVIAVWLYILSVLTRAKLYAWKFMWGSFGLFLIMMITIRPMLTMPLARCVSALAGVVGSVTGAFTSYFKYGIIFIHTGVTQATLLIDFECTGIIRDISGYIFISFLFFLCLRFLLIRRNTLPSAGTISIINGMIIQPPQKRNELRICFIITI